MTRWFITVEAHTRPDNESLTGMQRITITSDDLAKLLCHTQADRRKVLDRLVTPLIRHVNDGIEDAAAQFHGTKP